MNDAMKCAIYHEAGHAVVALHLGFNVDQIEAFEGFLRTICELDAADRTDEERYLVLAAGIAAETISFGRYDTTPCQDDQRQITARKGNAIIQYVPAATDVIKANENCFVQLRRKITMQLIAKNMERSIAGGGNSFCILNRDEIQQVWSTCGSR
jgi:hypothetical protein